MKNLKISLISKCNGMSIIGPMAPIFAAQSAAKQLGLKLHAVARIEQKDVHYTDKHVHNFTNERGAHCDMLVAMQLYKDNYVALLFMDEGVRSVPISMFDKEELYPTNDGTSIHSVYKDAPYSLHLTLEDIKFIQEQLISIHSQAVEDINANFN